MIKISRHLYKIKRKIISKKKLHIFILLTIILFICNNSIAQIPDTVCVIIIGKFKNHSKYILMYNDMRNYLNVSKGYYGTSFKFAVTIQDKKNGILSLELERVDFFGRYLSESINIQLFNRVYLVLYDDRMIKDKRYFNYHWLDEIDSSFFIPELYTILNELKLECLK